MGPKAVLLMTLVIVTQLAKTHSLSTAPNQSTLSNDSNKSSSLYVFGGFDESINPLDSASRLENGEWTTLNTMPMAKENFCGAVVDKQIYLFGGQTHNGTRYRFWNSAEVYDSLNDTYTFLQSMPEDRYYCAAAAMNDFVYVSGGLGDENSRPNGKLFRYDIRTNQWNTLAEMTYKRYGHQLVKLGGLLYVVGSWTYTEVYNPTTDRWSNVKNTNYNHFLPKAAAHQGMIYVLSWDGFEVYSPSNDKWTVLEAPAIVRGWDRSLVSMDGKLWAIGGNTYGNVMKGKAVYTYDSVTDRWTKQRNMDISRSSHLAFVVNH